MNKHNIHSQYFSKQLLMHIWFENSISKAIMASGCKCGYLRWTENVESERNKSGSLCARDVNSGCMACVLSSLCKYWRRGKQMIIKISSALLKYVWWENAKCFHTHERKKEKKKEPQQLYGKDTSKLINRQERLRYMKHRDKEGIWNKKKTRVDTGTLTSHLVKRASAKPRALQI